MENITINGKEYLHVLGFGLMEAHVKIEEPEPIDWTSEALKDIAISWEIGRRNGTIK